VSLHAYLLFFAIVALASFCQNLTGFAFGLILVGLVGALSLMPIGEAANAATIMSIANGAVYMRTHPFKPDWTLLKPMLVSSFVGVLIGVGTLSLLSSHALAGLSLTLGVAIVACAMLLFAQKNPRKTMSGQPALYMAGFLSGLLGGLFATPGPPMVYHLYRQPLPAIVIRQCLVVMFVTSVTIRLGLVVYAGTFALTSLYLGLAAVPIVALVTWLHAKHPPRIPPYLVRWLVCVLMLAAGGSLIFSAVARGV
jgi:uncharacterized membrane protein YfcA